MLRNDLRRRSSAASGSILNEVLSLNAQEWRFLHVHLVADQLSSMKS